MLYGTDILRGSGCEIMGLWVGGEVRMLALVGFHM
jgi:hypothetical protein